MEILPHQHRLFNQTLIMSWQALLLWIFTGKRWAQKDAKKLVKFITRLPNIYSMPAGINLSVPLHQRIKETYHHSLTSTNLLFHSPHITALRGFYFERCGPRQPGRPAVVQRLLAADNDGGENSIGSSSGRRDWDCASKLK